MSGIASNSESTPSSLDGLRGRKSVPPAPPDPDNTTAWVSFEDSGLPRPVPAPATGFGGTERFEIVGRLGRGGMSVVHAALDHTTGRRVALKVLREPRPERLSVLKREFRRVAGVVHPNLVHMHELFDGPQGTFFTMEIVDGSRLWDWVRAPHYDVLRISPERRPRGYDQVVQPLMGADAWTRLLSVARQLATALTALHGRDILHRDVKPSNALVRADGSVVVLDFGLARSLSEATSDAFGRVAGTLAYMAPEQLERGPMGTAADWYALGGTLFELATGCLPYPGDERALYESKIARGSPRRIRDLVPDVPPAFGDLVDALLDPAPALRPTGEAVLAALGLSAPAGQDTMPEAMRVELPPIGREAALAFLQGGLKEAGSLGRSLRELRGESGIGKSTLARWFARRARSSGTVVFRGECYERESIPFNAFDRLIDRLVDRIARRGEAGRAAVLPKNRAALLRLFPAFGRLPEFDLEGFASASDGDLARPPDSAAVRRDAFDALASLLARYASGRPMLVILDDVQWADRDSAALAAHLLSDPRTPLMVLLCRRPEGEAPDLQALAGDIPLPASRVYDLLPLPEDSARELARRALGPEHASEALVEAVVQESDGSPFWLEQVGLFSRAPTHMGPRDGVSVSGRGPLKELLIASIRDCPDSARDLLLVLSVAGRPVDRVLALEVGGESVFRSADRLEEVGLVVVRRTEVGAGVEVRHARVADAALALADAASRQTVHRRLGHALIGTGGDAEEISVHLRAAGEVERASEYTLLAARDVRDVLAFDRASRLLEAVIAVETDPAVRLDLMVESAELLANDSRALQAAGAYERAAAAAEGVRRLHLRHQAAEQLMRSGRVDRGRALLQELLAGQGIRLGNSAGGAILHLLWGRARLAMRGLEFEPRAAEDIAPEVLSRIDSAWSAAVTLGLVDAVAAAAFQVQGLLLALKVGEPQRVARALGAEAVFHAVFGNHDKAELLLSRYEQLIEGLDDPAERGGVALARAVAAYQRGDWRGCHEWSVKSLGHLAGLRTNLSWTRSTAVVYRLAAAGHLGRLDEITRVLPRELTHARARGDLHAVLHLSLGMPVALDAILDRPAEGIGRARTVWEDSPGRHYAQLQIHALRTEAELALVAADVDTALSAGDRGWKLANGADTRRIIVVRLSACELALRCELCAVAARGLDPKSLKRIQAHIRVLERSELPWAIAVAALAAAQVAGLQGDPGAALEGFERAAGLFADLDMTLHEEVSRFARGRLEGGQAGRRDRAKAVAWAERSGAVAPLRLFRMIAPALEG